MKKIKKNTEYIGAFEGKSLDSGKRMKFPVDWLPVTERRFIFVSREELASGPKKWDVYPYPKWSKIMNDLQDNDAKVSFASRSSKIITLDLNDRLLIPMGSKGKKITLIGVRDYIRIEEFTSKESAS